MRCESGLSKGLCLICENNQNSLNDSPSIFENSSQSPPHINHHCCYKCGDPLDGIFCKRCTCESCGKCAHIGYNCPPKVPVISNPKPCKNQTIDELPQTLPSFHPTCYSEDESPFTNDSTPNIVDDSPNAFNPPSQPSKYSYEFCGNDAYYGYDCPPQDYTITITPKEPDNSLSMRDEHLDIISATESNEFINSSVENLVPNPNFSSSDDESFPDEDISKKIYSNHLFDEEIISIKIDPHHFNAESDLIESLLNHNSSIISSSLKIDSLLDEFADELILLKSIPSRIDKADCDPEEEIRLIEKLLYDNSSPRPPKEFNSKNSDAIIESFSLSPIPTEDSDLLWRRSICFLLLMDQYPRVKRLKVEQKRVFSGSFRSRVLNIQDEDEVVKSPRACHWKEHEITVPTVKENKKRTKSKQNRIRSRSNGKRGKTWQYCGGLPEADHCQPSQYNVNHPIFNAHNDFLNSQNNLMEQLTSMCDMVGQYIQKKEEEKRIDEEQAAKAQNEKLPVCYDDDDDEERSNSLKDNIISGLPLCAAITPISLTEEPVDSLIVGDEHLNTILETESDEFIKSSVENLVPILNLDSTSKNDRFDTKSYLLESLLNHDESIPSGINSENSDSEGDNLFLERLLHDDPIPLPDILDFSNVVRVFLHFFTYPVTSSILLSSGSEDIIFDPSIFDYHFSYFMPVYLIGVELS
nr:hypothetical protein [Tanacetum cinerariifolium]